MNDGASGGRSSGTKTLQVHFLFSTRFLGRLHIDQYIKLLVK